MILTFFNIPKLHWVVLKTSGFTLRYQHSPLLIYTLSLHKIFRISNNIRILHPWYMNSLVNRQVRLMVTNWIHPPDVTCTIKSTKYFPSFCITLSRSKHGLKTQIHGFDSENIDAIKHLLSFYTKIISGHY